MYTYTTNVHAYTYKHTRACARVCVCMMYIYIHAYMHAYIHSGHLSAGGKGLLAQIHPYHTVVSGLLAQKFCGLAVRAAKFHDDVLLAYLRSAQVAGLRSVSSVLPARRSHDSKPWRAPVAKRWQRGETESPRSRELK